MCIIVETCLCMQLRSFALLGSIWVWLTCIPNMSIHVRQLKLLDDEGISVFNSADIKDETLRATSSFILFHIVSSLANMFSSLVCFVGLQRDIRLTLLPFIFTLVLGTIGEFVIGIMCWMVYWDDYYYPLSTAWRTSSVAFYLLLTAINSILIVDLISLYASMKYGTGLSMTMNDKLKESVNEEPVRNHSLDRQSTPRALPPPPVLDDKCKDIIDSTLSSHASFRNLQLDLTYMNSTQRTNSKMLSLKTLGSINNTLTRH